MNATETRSVAQGKLFFVAPMMDWNDNAIKSIVWDPSCALRVH